MVSPTSGLSLENTSVPDKIIDAIVTASKAITSIRIEDLPKIWESIVDGLKNIGKTLINQIKDFFFKDLPGLIIDIGFMVVDLLKKDFGMVLSRAKSALNHLTRILEVLSLVPLFAVMCSILLAVIYFCQQDWFNAVCALI